MSCRGKDNENRGRKEQCHVICTRELRDGKIAFIFVGTQFCIY